LERDNKSSPKDCAYFLCLIDWENLNLDSKENQEFANMVLGEGTEVVDDWIVKSLSWSNLDGKVSGIKLGFYHSRLIFQFNLISAPNQLSGIRVLRKKIEKEIEIFCDNTVIKAMKLYRPTLREPHIFVYPIFELNRKNYFWDSKFTKPYSMATTCFYTEIDDRSSGLLGREVKARISGAKIITTSMSDWFFYNLVNIVFHEGLYRQARDKQNKSSAYYSVSKKSICHGLENRLEDFAGNLMATFHAYSSEYVRRNIQKIALVASIIAIGITSASLVVAVLNLTKGAPVTSIPSNVTSFILKSVFQKLGN
jgi:hypothetical protein